jgi:hypothetical protein
MDPFRTLLRHGNALVRWWRDVSPASVLVAFCVVHPINPLCCPTPCPVWDDAKVADYLRQADGLWRSVEQCRDFAGDALSLVRAFGPNGPLAVELRRLPGNVSALVRTAETAGKGLWRTDRLDDPRAVAEMLKTTLVDPSSLPVNRLSGQMARLGQRLDLLDGSCLDGLAGATGQRVQLAAVAADGARQASTAAASQNLRGDAAAGSNARQAVLDTLLGVRSLLTLWLSKQAADGMAAHADSLGTLPAAAAPPSLAVRVTEASHRQAAAITVLQGLHELDGTVSALTAVHNQRHAASVMTAQYPGLWTTIASDKRAQEFRASDRAAAVSLLSQLFSDGEAAFDIVQGRLLALDRSGWRDSDVKTQAAAAAAQAVVQALAVDPGAFGALRGQGRADRDPPTAQALEERFAAWLESDKQVRFWAPLRGNAEAAIALLDRRRADMERRWGQDIGAASPREAALIETFDRQLASWNGLGKDSLPPAQQSEAQAFVGALTIAAEGVRADPAAARFVPIRWQP